MNLICPTSWTKRQRTLALAMAGEIMTYWNDFKRDHPIEAKTGHIRARRNRGEYEVVIGYTDNADAFIPVYVTTRPSTHT